MYYSFMKKARKCAADDLHIYETFINSFEWTAAINREKIFDLDAIVFADTHGHFSQRDRFEEFIYKHSKYDVCILLGDVAYEDIDMIMQYVPDYKMMSVLGNHDSPDLLRHFGLTDLNGKLVEYKGVRFAGMGGSHRYKRGNWPMMTQCESLELCLDMIRTQEAADILITHDKAFFNAEYDIAHTGLAGITTYVNACNPIYHLHGHQHVKRLEHYKNGTIEKSVFGAEYIKL